ncbi:helix-turn-helix domain-containing protein [Kibdelosporangium philippinense]|uniref:AraC-like ligand-binding domain-containing protein n=1 Tax=Kibdelosporangium philippinense TaxID=211113 RepID=UPI003618BFEE
MPTDNFFDADRLGHACCVSPGEPIHHTTFQSGSFDPSERRDAWVDHLSRMHAPIGMRVTAPSDFPAHQEVLQLGDVVVAASQHMPMTVERTPRMVRQSDPDIVYLGLPLHGTMTIEQAGWSIVHRRDRFTFHDSAQPCLVQSGAESRYRGLALHLPKSLLPRPVYKPHELMDGRLRADAGIGGLLAGTLDRLMADVDGFRIADGPRLGAVVSDLVVALFAHVMDSPVAPAPDGLLFRIKAFIQQRLGDDTLRPGDIAAAHHISTSYLHRLFKADGMSVAKFIRRQRLERISRDLANPASRGVPISVIAAQWGFPRAAEFSRAFRAAKGLTARDYRQQALTRFQHRDQETPGHRT